MFQNLETLLACPTCKSALVKHNQHYSCSNQDCQAIYPIRDEVPILIDDRYSTFSAADYQPRSGKKSWGEFRKSVKKFSPRLTANFAAKNIIPKFRQRLLASAPNSKVLILGGAEIGSGLQHFLQDQRIQFLETDIVIGTRTELVCDVSFLPIANESVDGTIIQAVLEYVPEPTVCVQEIHRVLRPGGLVYSEMPFLQDVHGGRYDFTRLTHLGHLRLYREFSEIESGACAGPATALAWALQHFCLSFVKSIGMRDAIKLTTSAMLFWLKYFDCFLVNRPAALDAATGTYLLARKSKRVLSDKDIIASYRGAVPKTQEL